MRKTNNTKIIFHKKNLQRKKNSLQYLTLVFGSSEGFAWPLFSAGSFLTDPVSAFSAAVCCWCTSLLCCKSSNHFSNTASHCWHWKIGFSFAGLHSLKLHNFWGIDQKNHPNFADMFWQAAITVIHWAQRWIWRYTRVVATVNHQQTVFGQIHVFSEKNYFQILRGNDVVIITKPGIRKMIKSLNSCKHWILSSLQ